MKNCLVMIAFFCINFVCAQKCHLKAPFKSEASPFGARYIDEVFFDDNVCVYQSQGDLYSARDGTTWFNNYFGCFNNAFQWNASVVCVDSKADTGPPPCGYVVCTSLINRGATRALNWYSPSQCAQGNGQLLASANRRILFGSTVDTEFFVLSDISLVWGYSTRYISLIKGTSGNILWTFNMSTASAGKDDELKLLPVQLLKGGPGFPSNIIAAFAVGRQLFGVTVKHEVRAFGLLPKQPLLISDYLSQPLFQMPNSTTLVASDIFNLPQFLWQIQVPQNCGYSPSFVTQANQGTVLFQFQICATTMPLLLIKLGTGQVLKRIDNLPNSVYLDSTSGFVSISGSSLGYRPFDWIAYLDPTTLEVVGNYSASALPYPKLTDWTVNPRTGDVYGVTGDNELFGIPGTL